MKLKIQRFSSLSQKKGIKKKKDSKSQGKSISSIIRFSFFKKYFLPTVLTF